MASYGEQLSGSGATAPSRTWLFDLDPLDRLRGITNPDGDQVTYTRDSRGNVTSETRIPKPGSGLSNLTTRQASFPATCVSYLTCSKPIWTKDAKGNQTDYTYDPNNGAVASVTGPADANGVRPQMRYSYVQRYAWILNSTGSYVHASAPIWVLDSESSCRASAATGNSSSPCAGNDEVKTSYDYGPDSGPNNLFLRGVVVTADGVSRRTCYTNDPQGNRISQTAPRAGLAVCS
jgi:YD repeat-containing protein